MRVQDLALAWWPALLAKVSGVIDFLVVHPYPVFGWDFHVYAYGNIALGSEVASVGAAVDRHAPPADRARLRLAVTETGVYDYGFKWQNWQARARCCSASALQRVCAMGGHRRGLLTHRSPR